MTWILRMAWRDSRGSRLHLLFSILAIALGIGAVVAIRSFNERLERAIANQSRTLLGTDLSVRSLHPFSEDTDAFLESLPGEQVRETRFFSMIRMPTVDATRLSQVRALSGPFPFYGEFDASPADALEQVLAGSGLAVVEENLLWQFGVEVGESLQIGAATFTIVGKLHHISGESPATTAFIGPRIFININDLPQTDLLREGSLARYYAHFKATDAGTLAALLNRPRRDWSDRRLEIETVEERQAVVGNTLDNLNQYLALGGFVALLLGGIGLAGAIQLYVRQKKTTVSVLRCLGASARTAFSVYVTQVIIAAFIGAIFGAVFGFALQQALPILLADFLPVEIDERAPLSAAVLGVLYGVGLAVAFALYPLAPLRLIPPLHALRADLAPANRVRFDRWQALVLLALVIALTGFAIAHTHRALHGILIASSLALVFILLWGTARFLVAGSRRWARAAWPFALRQGIANMHRPYNQTGILLLALGLGTFLLSVLSLTQNNLLHQFQHAERDGQPNLVLFDIQRDQIDPVLDIFREANLEAAETTPIVTMRLLDVNGRSVSALRDDPDLDTPDWVLFREYRTTYRDSLRSEDRVVAGTWQGHFDPTQGAAPVPISIESVMAQHLDIGIGARLTFDVQGVRMRTRVASIRRVDWRAMRTNFMVIFPSGVLEEAPQYYATLVRVPDAPTSALIQNQVVQSFPNISAFDLRMLVQSLDEWIGRAAFVVRFMALFSLATGLVVLGSMIVTSRYDRKADVDLLRTLGATRRQLNRIMMAEYALLGFFASLAGVTLAILASWALANHVFNYPFNLAFGPIVMIPLAVTASAIVVGLLVNHWSIRR